MNAREQLAAVADWLGWQDESLSFGLRNSMDALRLHDYAQAHPNLPEMADEWKPKQRIAALGYDPLATDEATNGREVGETGATAAYKALQKARALIDSVAYVAKEGDSGSVLASIDAVI
jgi:hypothetical protein